MNNKKNYITRLQRLNLYNSYEGHCAFCGREINYRDMVACSITGYHLPCCKTCSNSSYKLDLEGFRSKISNSIKQFYNSHIGNLLYCYSGLDSQLNENIIFYFEKENNKIYLHEISMKDRMTMLNRNITSEELLTTCKLPQWCSNTKCIKWLNLKIFTIEDCKYCNFKKNII